jgi:hypothetical protein
MLSMLLLVAIAMWLTLNAALAGAAAWLSAPATAARRESGVSSAATR